MRIRLLVGVRVGTCSGLVIERLMPSVRHVVVHTTVGSVRRVGCSQRPWVDSAWALPRDRMAFDRVFVDWLRTRNGGIQSMLYHVASLDTYDRWRE